MPVAAAAGLFLMDDDSTVRLFWGMRVWARVGSRAKKKNSPSKETKRNASAGGGSGGAASMEEE